MRKGISIGPLDDGKTYKYDFGSRGWFDDEGPVDLLPYKRPSTNGRTETFYFHTESHKWTDEYGLILPSEYSINIDYAFRRKYGINGEVTLFAFKTPRQKAEPEDPEEDDSPDENPYDIGDFDVQALQES